MISKTNLVVNWHNLLYYI